MTILLTNDDGIDAPGLYALAEALLELDDVFIAAPDRERSGVGHAITIKEPLHLKELAPCPDGVKRITTDGTPADTVKFALRHYLDSAPSLIVSGPNTGPNVGINVFYSGTIGAASEANMSGISSVAVSSDLQNGEWNWKACCHYARRVVKWALFGGRGPKAPS